MVPHCWCKLAGKYSVQAQCEDTLMNKTVFGECGFFSLGKFRIFSVRAKKTGRQYRSVFKGDKMVLAFITKDS